MRRVSVDVLSAEAPKAFNATRSRRLPKVAALAAAVEVGDAQPHDA